MNDNQSIAFTLTSGNKVRVLTRNPLTLLDKDDMELVYMQVLSICEQLGISEDQNRNLWNK